jgi:hypothetical protein
MSRRSHIKRAKVLGALPVLSVPYVSKGGSGANWNAKVLSWFSSNLDRRARKRLNLANAIRGGYPK